MPHPWDYLYGTAAVAFWVVFSVVIAHILAREEGEKLGNAHIGFGVAIGLCAAMIWPIVLACTALWYGIRRVLREH